MPYNNVSSNKGNAHPQQRVFRVYQFADIDSGKVETVPLTEDFFDRLKDLMKDVDPEDENETN